MLTNNIFLKSFLRKKSESKIKKKLKLIVEQKNELFKSMSKDYIDSYNLKKIKKITKKNSIKLIGIGGSILGSQAIYNFLRDKIKKNFISEMLDEKETVEMIKIINEEYEIVVDPHTAVGIGAARKLGLEKNCVVLSTAHPCKFPNAIEDAISKTEDLPDSLNYVNDRKEKFEVLSNDIEKVKKYVINSI